MFHWKLMIAILLLIVLLCMNKRESFDISKNILINPSLTNIDGKTLIESENDDLQKSTAGYANQMYTQFRNFAIYEKELEEANIDYANLQAESNNKIYDLSNAIQTLTDLSSNIGQCIQKYYTNGSGTPQADPKDLSMFQTSKYTKDTKGTPLPVTELMAILTRLRQSFTRTMNAINIHNHNIETAYSGGMAQMRGAWFSSLIGSNLLNENYIRQRISRFKMLDIYPVMLKLGDPGFPINGTVATGTTSYNCNCYDDCYDSSKKYNPFSDVWYCPLGAGIHQFCSTCYTTVYGPGSVQDDSFYNANGYYNTNNITTNKYLNLYQNYRSNNALLSSNTTAQPTRDFISYIEKFINLSNWNGNPLINDNTTNATQTGGKNTPLNITTSNYTTASYYNKISINTKVFEDMILKYSTTIYDDFISLNPTATAMTYTDWLKNYSKSKFAGWTEQANIDYGGNDIGTGNATLDEVKERCASDMNCKGFNWNPSDNKYWYKYKLGTSSTLPEYNFYTKANQI